MAFPKMTKYLNAATFGVLLLADAALPVWATSAIARREEVFEGVARDERGDIVYTEEHRMIYENGRPSPNETPNREPRGRASPRAAPGAGGGWCPARGPAPG